MKADDIGVLKFMWGSHIFTIPVYQRNYSWTYKNCKRLFDDIEGIDLNDIGKYFLGSTVVVNAEVGEEIIIIDGQQRLTSISLIMFAIYNLLKLKNIKSDSPKLADTIYEYYLVNVDKDKHRMRLKQVNQDAEAYNNLYLLSDNLQTHAYNTNPELKKTKIFKNYQYFVKRVKAYYKTHGKIDGLWDALKRLEIVKIELELSKKDHPQLIFETINKTGEPLNDADLIRNYILIDKKPEIQKKWYESYWKPIEFYTHKDNEPETWDAIWHYLMYKNNDYFTREKTYTEFKDFISRILKSKQEKSELESAESVLSELVRFTKYYKWFNDVCQNETFETYFKVFRILKQKTPYAYFMSLMDLYDNKQQLNEQTVCEVLQFILNYYIRRTVTGRSPIPYSKRYPKLANEINEYMNQGNNYMESVYYVFSNFPTNEHYPTNEEIKLELPTKDFYNIRKQTKSVVLQKMCNFDQNESIVLDENITIEHIMPQSKFLSENWKNELGKDWESVHEKYVHTIGNLTLIGNKNNSKLGTKSFLQKKELMQQYSNIPLNKHFNSINSWDDKQILKNAERMIGLFNQVFTDIPNRTKYKKEYSTDYIPIEYIENVTGTKIQSYKILGKIKNPVDTSWIHLLKSICKDLYESDESVDCQDFVNNPDTLTIPYEISDGVYIETNKRSAVRVKNMLVRILEKYDCVGELALKLEKV